VSLAPTLLIVPSLAAAVELPRRLAQAPKAIAGLYPMKLRELAARLAEPLLLGRGFRPWDTGHDALIAARLLAKGHALSLAPSVPLRSVAVPLSRTLAQLRAAAVQPDALLSAAELAVTPEDEARLRALADLYRRYTEEVEGRFADPATLFREAALRVGSAPFLEGAQALVAGPLELDPLEAGLLAALARRIPVRALDEPLPNGLRSGSFREWAPRHGVAVVAARETLLAPLETPPPLALRRLREQLFEPPAGSAIVDDGSLELLTAPGEAAEVRAIARRILREAARGVPFEEIGIALAQPQTYAPLLTDLLPRLGIPVKLHPSLPLRFGHAARSLLLLFRCRELQRAAVMEFLTFAPIPFSAMLELAEPAPPARWDAISRDAGIVSGAERWGSALAAFADDERVEAAKDPNPDRRVRRLQRVAEADALRLVVARLQATLELLGGAASWPEWSQRLAGVVGQWIGEAADRDAVLGVIADLAALQALEPRVEWEEVEHVVETRFEWERVPLPPVTQGAVHAGALDAIGGIRFRVLMFPGLVEGSFPGVLRPDPLLLDNERLALRAPRRSPAARAGRRAARTTRQLSLFDAPLAAAPAEEDAFASLSTTQDLLLEQRRLFHRACAQASEKLVLSYPRADPRSGRERLPSLFFVAAAQALQARPLATAELARLTGEDDLRALPLELALDRGERDLVRVRRGGREAALQIAAGSRFFRHSHLASEARWSRDFTPYDGLVALPPKDGEDAEAARLLRERLDPIVARGTVSASRLARYASCGFQYFLENVLRLEPTLEPEERKRLEPLERGSLFHDVAEDFLRELRDNGLLPVRDSQAERQRLTEMADAALARHVADHPPRFKLLWERECRRFKETLLTWLAREARAAEHSTPAFFEVGFGPSPGGEAGPSEPHMQEPLEIDLGDGRALRVSGRIDRIDRRPDGKLVLRDYKTGRAPKDEAGLFRGGRQLQIPFYVLAAARIFPEQPVVEAFLDYVDGGRQVALDLNVVQGEPFRNLLRGLVDGIAGGVFVQEPAICEWCDFTMVCGPKTLIGLRRERKRQDPRIVKALGLKHL
jgi:RecB family exonuclease